MKRFVISEEEKKHIMGLYEETTKSDLYSSVLGYLDIHGKQMMNDYKGDKMEFIQSKKNVMIYCEDKRDGKNVSDLTLPQDKALLSTTMQMVKDSPNIGEYIQKGKNIKTNRQV